MRLRILLLILCTDHAVAWRLIHQRIGTAIDGIAVVRSQLLELARLEHMGWRIGHLRRDIGRAGWHNIGCLLRTHPIGAIDMPVMERASSRWLATHHDRQRNRCPWIRRHTGKDRRTTRSECRLPKLRSHLNRRDRRSNLTDFPIARRWLVELRAP